MKNIVSIIVVVLILIGGYFALNKKQESKNIPTIKIGVIAPLTGARADAGEYTKNALELAKVEINKKFQKYTFDFILEDSQYEPLVAVSALNKLINLDGVKYVIGPYGSSEVMAAGPIAEQSKVMLLTPGAQTDEVSFLGDYIFRIIHHSSQEVPVFAPFVAQKMKGATLHFLTLNTAITDPYLKVFLPEIESRGKKTGLIERFDAKSADFRTELIKFKNANASDIFLIATPKHVAIIMQQAKDLGLNAQFYNIGVEGPELLSAKNNVTEGLFYPYSYDNSSSEPSIEKFYTDYTARFGSSPDTVAANTYDAAILLADCINEVGDDSLKVKECLYSVKDFEGAGGKFSIDSKGDAIKNIFVKTIRNGQFVKLEN